MGTTREYQICTRCIMDTTDPDIDFDNDGICNHCRKYDKREKNELYKGSSGQKKLNILVDEIKKQGKGKAYDCIIGLSGGIDSAMVAYTVKKMGLRPLAIHLDNGWDTELSVKNIENIVKKLDIDLHTYVVDWEEFRDLQLSFLKASVANSEIPTDHAIVAILFRTAVKEGVKYIISGGNIVTEAIMPASWGYDPKDWKHIKGLHKIFGKIKPKTFPHLNIFDWFYYIFVKGVTFIPILNYIDYNKESVIRLLEKELGWKYYGGKHYESIYTRFFQAHILPTKFNIDKRRAHLSTLVCSGQLTRGQALEEMKQELYSPDKLKDDEEYIIKKFGLKEGEFKEIMASPIKSYKDYPNDHFLFNKLDFIARFAKKLATRN